MSTALVTAKEAGDILGLSRTTIYSLAADGRLAKAYIGRGTRNFRITTASIQAYIESLSADPVEVER